MEHFISDENSKHYRILLEDPGVANDPVRHATILRLLAEEKAKKKPPT